MIEWQDGEGPVLAVFAHPDDAEISSGGTLAKWAAQGREVHLLILTNGDRGSDDPDTDREELARTRAEATRLRETRFRNTASSPRTSKRNIRRPPARSSSPRPSRGGTPGAGMRS